MTRTGDREIGVVSGRLPDNPGELACMYAAGDLFSSPLPSTGGKEPSANREHSVSLQGSYWSWKTWKIMEFRNFIFQAWKVTEVNCQSLKVIEN